MITDLCPICQKQLYKNKFGQYSCRVGNLCHFQITGGYRNLFVRMIFREKYKARSEFLYSELTIYTGSKIYTNRNNDNIFLTKFYRYKYKQGPSKYYEKSWYNESKGSVHKIDLTSIKIDLTSKEKLSKFISAIEELSIFK